MDIFVELFSTFTGLLSLFVIVFMLGMAVFFGVWFMKNSKPPSEGGPENGTGGSGSGSASG
jgi:hypothetical protein